MQRAAGLEKSNQRDFCFTFSPSFASQTEIRQPWQRQVRAFASWALDTKSMTCHEVALQFDSRGETGISKAAPPLSRLYKGKILIMN